MERMENMIGKLLITGVTLSGIIVFAGGLLYLYHHGGAGVHYGVFKGEPSDLKTLTGVIRDAFTLEGRGIIQLGLVILVAVQIVRVALTAALFATIRDRAFVWISLFVLGVLIYSLLEGQAG